MSAQLDAGGRLRHLLTLDGLPRPRIEALLQRAQAIADDPRGATSLRHVLAGKAVCTLFFEPSTRTRSSFALAPAAWAPTCSTSTRPPRPPPRARPTSTP